MRHPTRLAGKLPVSTLADANEKAANDGPEEAPAELFQDPPQVSPNTMPKVIDKWRLPAPLGV